MTLHDALILGAIVAMLVIVIGTFEILGRRDQ